MNESDGIVLLTLVLVIDEDVIGHIEEDHGNYAKVVYNKDGIKHSEYLSSDNYIVVDEIYVKRTEIE